MRRYVSTAVCLVLAGGLALLVSGAAFESAGVFLGARPAEGAPESATPFAPRKRAWEASVGGQRAAREHLRARLVGWPARLRVDAAELPADDGEFLWRVARDTWRGIAALSDRENGLPIDHLRLAEDSLAASDASIGDYVTPASIGLHLLAVVAARDLGLASQQEAVARTERVLATLDGLESHRGVLYNFYDTTSLERTTDFLSFVDSAWLTAGLMVVRASFPELAEPVTRLIEARDYSFFYDRSRQEMSHGYHVDAQAFSPYHYGTLYTEARLGSLIAIGKGDVPEEHWRRLRRAFPPGCIDGASGPPALALPYELRRLDPAGGCYEWKGLRYVPSWGGSMFEALMPLLLVDEPGLAPRSLGRNAAAHVEIQRRYALEELGWPVWGMSPAVAPRPEEYREYGVSVLGARGYEGGAVTPHAVALALAVAPATATANLRELARRYDLYGDFGFYDSVDPVTGQVGRAYLALDQSMLFVALANHLEPGALRSRFAADPIAAPALSLLAREDLAD